MAEKRQIEGPERPTTGHHSADLPPLALDATANAEDNSDTHVQDVDSAHACASSQVTGTGPGARFDVDMGADTATSHSPKGVDVDTTLYRVDDNNLAPPKERSCLHDRINLSSTASDAGSGPPSGKTPNSDDGSSDGMGNKPLQQLVSEDTKISPPITLRVFGFPTPVSAASTSARSRAGALNSTTATAALHFTHTELARPPLPSPHGPPST